jgi:hypothetical protein
MKPFVGQEVYIRYNVGGIDDSADDPFERFRAAGSIGVIEVINERGTVHVNIDGVFYSVPFNELDECLRPCE